MERYLVISTDCHAGLPPGGYREYLDPQYREHFDVEIGVEIALLNYFLGGFEMR